MIYWTPKMVETRLIDAVARLGQAAGRGAMPLLGR